jgi:hypothetical protein
MDDLYVGGKYWRGRTGPQKARIMVSPLSGQKVKMPAQRPHPTPRYRAHRSLRDVVYVRH